MKVGGISSVEFVELNIVRYLLKTNKNLRILCNFSNCEHRYFTSRVTIVTWHSRDIGGLDFSIN